MKIEISKKFKKDTASLSSEAQKKIFVLLSNIEAAEDMTGFDVTKMVGYSNYYRIRMGIYRLGYKLEQDGSLKFERVAKRDEIYKIYP